MGKASSPSTGWLPAALLATRQWVELGVDPELSGSVRRCQYMTHATPALVLLMVLFYLPIFLWLGNWTLARTCLLQMPVPLIGMAWFHWRQACGQPPHYWKACFICQVTTLLGITAGQGSLLGTHFYFLLFFLTTPLVVPIGDRIGMALTCGICLVWFVLFHYFAWPAAPEVEALPLPTLKALNLIVLLSGSAILFIALVGSEYFSDLLENRIQQLATTDSLTTLGNRHLFYSALAQLRGRYEKDGQAFCLAMLDLDYFKRVNDSYGHDVGDEVLQHVAALLRSSVRASDRVCRIGGEEFAILFADTSLERACIASEAVRRTIANAPWHTGGKDIRVTVSLGLVEWNAASSEQTLLAAADRALYAAKHAGRNQVQCHQEREPTVGAA